MRKIDADVALVMFGMGAAALITGALGARWALTPSTRPTGGDSRALVDASSGFTTLIDADGFRNEFSGVPKRIVSVAVATDEFLLPMVSNDRVAALSAFAGDPTMSNVAKQAAAVRGRVRGDAEAIVSERPDLVLATEFLVVEVVELLRSLGTPVHRVRRHEELSAILQDDAVLNRALNHTVRDDANQWPERLASAQRKSGTLRRAPSVLLVQAGGYTAGTGTLWNDLVHRAGAVNHAEILGVRGYARLEAELALASPPDYVVVAEVGEGELPSWLKADREWSQNECVRQGRVIAIPGRLLSTVSPFAVECLETLIERLLEAEARFAPRGTS